MKTTRYTVQQLYKSNETSKQIARSWAYTTKICTHMHWFNSYFLGNTRLVGCPLISLYHMLWTSKSYWDRQTNTFHILLDTIQLNLQRYTIIYPSWSSNWVVQYKQFSELCICLPFIHWKKKQKYPSHLTHFRSI